MGGGGGSDGGSEGGEGGGNGGGGGGGASGATSVPTATRILWPKKQCGSQRKWSTPGAVTTAEYWFGKSPPVDPPP